jgi:hypothetical protein
LLTSLWRHLEATKENSESILLNPDRSDSAGDRRIVHWEHLPELNAFMKVV